MRDAREYWICARGIYYTTSAYHDDIDYHYVVDLEKPDVGKQFQRFLEDIMGLGERKAIRDLKSQFKTLKELLG